MTEQNTELRYARQIVLDGWGREGQARLAAARVLVIGLGGLGAPIVTYLAGAGVGELTLNDFDTVDASNLPRQSLYRSADVGQRKTRAAQDFVARRNPHVATRMLDQRLTPDELVREAHRHDLIVDASDNFGTRFAVNAASVAAAVPLVSAAAIRFEGQVALFDRRHSESACYACLYDEDDAAEGDCVGQGVFTPLVGLIGSLAAARALRVLLSESPASGVTQLVCLDGDGVTRQVRVPRDPACRLCSGV